MTTYYDLGVFISEHPNASDEELRSFAKEFVANGYYGLQICRKCGEFQCHPNSQTDTCKIVLVCRECFDK